MALGKPLKTGPCKHMRKHKDKNRKGREYWECDSCGAFLGWA